MMKNYFHGADVRRVSFQGKRLCTPFSSLLRQLLIPAILLGTWSFGTAQHNLLLYNMRQVPQSHLLNPGVIPEVKYYIGLPVISGVRLGAGTNNLTLNQFQSAEMTNAYDFDFASVFRELGAGDNRLVTEAEVRLLSLGTRIGKGYLHFDIGERLFSSSNYPRELLAMFDDIQQLRLTDQAALYNLNNLEFNGTHYRTFSVGYTRQFLPRLSAGIRAHYLQGISNVWEENEGLQFRYPGDGSFLQLEGRMNVLSAGLKQYHDFGRSLLLQGTNSGFAIDAGGAFQASDQFTLSFSVVNLGMIKWRNDINYQVFADPLQFSASDIDEHLDRWGELGDSLVNATPPTNNVRYQTPLPAQFYLGGNLQVRPNTDVGILLHAVHYNQSTDLAFALSGNTQVSKIFRLSAALSYNRHQPFNLGTGFSLDLGPVQLYTVIDNFFGLIDYKDSYSAQAQFGINLNLGRSGPQDLVPEEDLQVQLDSLATPSPAAVPQPVEEARPEPYTISPDEELLQPDLRPLDIPFEEPAPPEEVPVSSQFTFAGTAYEEDTNDPLRGISVEAYRIDSSGQKVLAYTGSFYNGRIELPLQRGYSHQVIISKPAYQAAEFLIEASRTRKSNRIEKDFTLRPGTMESTAPVNAAPPEPAPEVPGNSENADDVAGNENEEVNNSATLSQPADVIPSMPLSPPHFSGEREAEAGEEKLEGNKPTEPTFGFYRLLDKTSLRQGPTHTTDVLLRFDIGDQVDILEKTNKYWWKARYRNRIGYVKAHLLERDH